jgi:ribonuclease P protein component
MLQKRHRLASERDFNRIFKKGKTTNGNTLSVRVVRNNRPESRVAFVVSTKVSKRAVVRNLLKRRLREIVRPLVSTLIPGLDIVVMTKVQTLALSVAELRQSMVDVLKKARVARV